ncbi:hypothetical protein [Amycolatopsis dendrobii]|uniref:Uncharacterized protein n=1 Tax=Amycolatopsis dendrobii TaxID=2760662 RepID=A0A7W3VUJ3_9PSEU|nr:hypothetical protein [Amycolatopsis dendrobii]MBB1153471.1 hypothetical protein [Amycolatopsis dendrobii]
MTKIKDATDIVKLLNAVLMGVSIGLTVAKSIRETFREMADDPDFRAKVAAARAAKAN